MNLGIVLGGAADGFRRGVETGKKIDEARQKRKTDKAVTDMLARLKGDVLSGDEQEGRMTGQAGESEVRPGEAPGANMSPAVGYQRNQTGLADVLAGNEKKKRYARR